MNDNIQFLSDIDNQFWGVVSGLTRLLDERVIKEDIALKYIDTLSKALHEWVYYKNIFTEDEIDFWNLKHKIEIEAFKKCPY